MVASLTHNVEGSCSVTVWLVGINYRISQQQGNHLLVAFRACHEEWSCPVIQQRVGINPLEREEKPHDPNLPSLTGTGKRSESSIVPPINMVFLS